MPRKAAPRCDGLTDDELVTYDLLPVAPPAPLAPADQCYQPGRRYVGIAPTASARQRVAEADNVVPLPRERSAGSRTIVLLKLFFERWRTMSDRIRSASARPRSGPRSAARRLLPPFSGSDKAVSNTQDSLRHHALVKRPVSSASPRRSPVQRAAVARDRVWGPPPAVPWQTGFFGWCRQSRSGR
jgi:hypothetical protein